MATSKGKQWEAVVKENWKNSFPNTFYYRLPDQQNGYMGSTNPCDAIAFNNGTLYLLECKSHEGNTLPFSAIPQYERMLPYVGMQGIRVGLVVWFIDHENKIAYIPIATMTKMIEDGKKSIHVKDFDEDKYRIIKIPSVKKRTFYTSDYSILTNELKDGD